MTERCYINMLHDPPTVLPPAETSEFLRNHRCPWLLLPTLHWPGWAFERFHPSRHTGCDRQAASEQPLLVSRRTATNTHFRRVPRSEPTCDCAAFVAALPRCRQASNRETRRQVCVPNHPRSNVSYNGLVALAFTSLPRAPQTPAAMRRCGDAVMVFFQDVCVQDCCTLLGTTNQD